MRVETWLVVLAILMAPGAALGRDSHGGGHGGGGGFHSSCGGFHSSGGGFHSSGGGFHSSGGGFNSSAGGFHSSGGGFRSSGASFSSPSFHSSPNYSSGAGFRGSFQSGANRFAPSFSRSTFSASSYNPSNRILTTNPVNNLPTYPGRAYTSSPRGSYTRTTCGGNVAPSTATGLPTTPVYQQSTPQVTNNYYYSSGYTTTYRYIPGWSAGYYYPGYSYYPGYYNGYYPGYYSGYYYSNGYNNGCYNNGYYNNGYSNGSYNNGYYNGDHTQGNYDAPGYDNQGSYSSPGGVNPPTGAEDPSAEQGQMAPDGQTQPQEGSNAPPLWRTRSYPKLIHSPGVTSPTQGQPQRVDPAQPREVQDPPGGPLGNAAP